MKRTLALTIIVLLMVWLGDASDSGSTNRGEAFQRMSFRHNIKDTVQSSSNAWPWSKDTMTSTVHSAAAAAAPSTSGKTITLGEMQGDQDKPSDRRRLLVKRRRNQQGNPGQSVMVQDEAAPGTQAKQSHVSSSSRSPSLLAHFAGKNRVMVISSPHESDGYYRLMMNLLTPDVYCELAERHVQQIVMFHQEGEMGGKVRRITNEGRILEEPMDTALIPRLMNHLKLEKGKFGIVLLRKTMQVEERYPYPVRLEAIYEVIDQAPMRRLEKIRQKGFVKKCKGAGVEGQVVASSETGISNSDPKVDASSEWKPKQKSITRPAQSGSTKTAEATTTTTTTASTTITATTTASTTTLATTTSASLTTAVWITPPHPTTTTSATTQNPTKSETLPQWLPATDDPSQHSLSINLNTDRNLLRTALYPTRTFDYYTKTFTDSQINEKDSRNEDIDLTVTEARPSKTKQPKRPSAGTVISNEYDDSYRETSVTTMHPDNSEVAPVKKGKNKQQKAEKKKKVVKSEKTGKRGKAEKKAKTGKGEGHNRNAEKQTNNKQDKHETQRPSKKPGTFKALTAFMDYFESRRRLIVITSPSEEHGMYVQQRDEYLEHVCDMAIRKLSIITIFGTLTNSTMKIDHYQLEHDRPMKGLRKGELMNQDLITELREEYDMTDNEFFMVLTDLDMKVKQYYEVPISMKAVFDYMDTFASRIKEMEDQRRDGIMCKKEDKLRSLENFLSRFRWRRRLFIISSPSDEEWAYQQQLQAMSSQACNLGLRHVSILKLVGVDSVDMGGVLELYAINGNATVEREGLSMSLVKDVRNYFQITPEYFSMLLVGKDGNVKSWYPSPMWSMATVYDMVDSMQLRRQEMAIQQSLGMRCPEEEYGGYGYHNQRYHDDYHDGYHQGHGY